MLSVFGYCVTCGRLVAIKYLRTITITSPAITGGGKVAKDKVKVCKKCDTDLQTPRGISNHQQGINSI